MVNHSKRFNDAGKNRRPRILLVDDEEDIVAVINKGLLLSNFDVDAYTRPKDALDNFKAGIYDLLLLDIRMPGMDGFELYRKAKSIDPSVRVCFLSAFEIYEDEFKKAFPSSNMAAVFIKKPISMADLVNQIELELQRATTKTTRLCPGDHILAIYSDREEMLDEGLRHLQTGLVDRDESVLLIINEPSKDNARKRMAKEWKVNVDELEAKRRITIKTFNEWYFPEGEFDAKATTQRWIEAVQSAVNNGSKGLRAFGDMSPFFKLGREVELVDYEATLGKRMDAPITGICAYTADNIKGLPPLKAKQLLQCHQTVLGEPDK